MKDHDRGGHGGRRHPGRGRGACGEPTETRCRGESSDSTGPGRRGLGGGHYRRSVLEAAILSSLAEATTHGYNLVDQIEKLTGNLVCIDAGSMYRLLRALEAEGLVTSSWKLPEAGPSRRVYTITDQGLDTLQVMAKSLTQRAASLQQLANHAATVAVAAAARRADAAAPASSDAPDLQTD